LQKSKPLPWVELEPYRRGKKSSQSVEGDERWNVIIRHRPELDE
jgi:hypothetical protein